MNAERLLAQFERISEAPDAIPRLRRFILDLAVRGKLVEQDPEDEPAEEILNRVSADISNYQQTFNIRSYKEKRDSSSGPPFRLPSGWQWTRLSGVFRSITDGDHQAPPRADEGVPFLVISDIRSGVIDYNGSRFVPASYYEGLDIARRPAIGDLLYTLVGSFGIPTIVRELIPFCVQRHIGILRPSELIPVEFLALLMDSMLVYKQASDIATGLAQKTVPLGGLRSVRVPLPPLAEQHRIVAKVDELMALCDQLEAARQQREQLRERLVAASLQRLNQPSDDPESFRSDARFALQVLPSLTTTPAQIKQLRQTILNLAVRGKLVEQDPEDEPAGELLKRLAHAKQKLIDSKLIKKPKPWMPIAEKETPISLPKNWAWSRLCDIGRLAGGMTPSMSRPDYWDGDISWLSPKDIKADEVDRSEMKITAAGLEETQLELYPPGSLFIVARSGILKRTLPVAINRVPAAANQDLKVLVPYLKGGERYLQIMFRGLTDFLLKELVKTGTTVQSLKYAEFEQQAFPIPPLAEQHRIVAKVDELMALCDQLEQQLCQADQQRRRLLEAVLAEALAKPEPVLEGLARP